MDHPDSPTEALEAALAALRLEVGIDEHHRAGEQPGAETRPPGRPATLADALATMDARASDTSASAPSGVSLFEAACGIPPVEMLDDTEHAASDTGDESPPAPSRPAQARRALTAIRTRYRMFRARHAGVPVRAPRTVRETLRLTSTLSAVAVIGAAAPLGIRHLQTETTSVEAVIEQQTAEAVERHPLNDDHLEPLPVVVVSEPDSQPDATALGAHTPTTTTTTTTTLDTPARVSVPAQRRIVRSHGLDNGRIPADALDFAADDRCSLVPPAAKAFEALHEAAHADGVDFHWSGCYRSYDAQVSTKARWCDAGHCEMAAEPGTSVHGEGLAADLAVGGRGMRQSDEAYEWLMENGPDYGWHNPDWARGGFEPWHWEYYGPLEPWDGDISPLAPDHTHDGADRDEPGHLFPA